MTDLEVPRCNYQDHISLPSRSIGNRNGRDVNDPERLTASILPRKEVIHPHLPVRIPCYDFIPVTTPTLGPSKVGTSGVGDFRDVTGGVYKTRERIQRGMLTHVY